MGVSERDLADAGILTRAYYTLGLFFLGGLDLGTPVGGPEAARTVLWLAYFAAPLITGSWCRWPSGSGRPATTWCWRGPDA